MTRDECRTRAGIEGAANELVSVAVFALQRDEEIALFERARIDRHALDREGARRLTERCGSEFFGCPESRQTRLSRGRPPTATAALMASSRSEKGWVTPATI